MCSRLPCKLVEIGNSTSGHGDQDGHKGDGCCQMRSRYWSPVKQDLESRSHLTDSRCWAPVKCEVGNSHLSKGRLHDGQSPGPGELTALLTVFRSGEGFLQKLSLSCLVTSLKDIVVCIN